MTIRYATKTVHYIMLEFGIFPNVHGKPPEAFEQRPAY